MTSSPGMLQLILLWSFAETASASLRAGDVMSAFIYLSTGSNSSVGFIQGINGIMQVCQKCHTSPTFGKYKYSRLLRLL